MNITLQVGDDYITITKAKLCCIKECDQYATEHLCMLGMCKKHHNEMRD